MPTSTPKAASKVQRAWWLALLTAAVLASTAARADEDSERESLARISAELDQVKAMVATAAKQAPTGQRIKFRYDWLMKDLQLMQDGINNHLDAPRQPRMVEPLRGDYRQ